MSSGMRNQHSQKGVLALHLDRGTTCFISFFDTSEDHLVNLLHDPPLASCL
jgi:hypothetical protein